MTPPAPPRPAQAHHQLAAAAVLPLFDSLFGVALTLLAFSLPEHLTSQMDGMVLAETIVTYLLTGVAVVIYWYKLRRWIEVSRQLLIPQLLLGMASLLLIMLMPRLVQLVVLHGGGSGDLQHWTASQIVNTVFLTCLLIFDGLCLLFGLSLLRHPFTRPEQKPRLIAAVQTQALGFSLLSVLGVLELVSTAFNNEYVVVVPAILVLEEWWVARRLRRI